MKSYATLFHISPQTIPIMPNLRGMPDTLLELIKAQLEDKEVIYAAMVNRQLYQQIYPMIKAAMVKVLKHLIKEDDTVQIKKLLKQHRYLLAKTDPWDLQGKAYKGLETTPYQDSLADPFQEEVRTILEASFPVSAEEKLSEEERTKQRLAQAALQAQEFQEARFDKYRDKQTEVMRLTKFAYETYFQAGDWPVTPEDEDDAWKRIRLVQDLWPKRLGKIFSTVDMDEKQNFENLSPDLPQLHFTGTPDDRGLPGTVGDYTIRLRQINEEEDINGIAFKEKLRRSRSNSPVLLRQGRGQQACYYFYGQVISLSENKSETHFLQIKDQRVLDLMSPLEPIDFLDPSYSTEEYQIRKNNEKKTIDFSDPILEFDSAFDDLYRWGQERGMFLGSNASRQGMRMVEGNFTAITTLYEKRTQNLARHLKNLEAYLPTLDVDGISLELAENQKKCCEIM